MDDHTSKISRFRRMAIRKKNKNENINSSSDIPKFRNSSISNGVDITQLKSTGGKRKANRIPLSPLNTDGSTIPKDITPTCDSNISVKRAKNPNTVKFTPISNVFTNIQNSSGESSQNGNANASHGQSGTSNFDSCEVINSLKDVLKKRPAPKTRKRSIYIGVKRLDFDDIHLSNENSNGDHTKIDFKANMYEDAEKAGILKLI
ncbi:hypothetical protein P8452_37024 [Trifolium repens]|nr:hypothetical protein P8452_37024 [Trifolium repens]